VHKPAGKTLQGTEEFFRSIFENAQIGISFFNIDGQAVFTNLAFQEMLGYTEKELSHLEKWDQIIHPDERVFGAERYAELIRGKCEKDEWVQRFICRDGRIVITYARFSLIRDAAGKPQYVASLTEDITESKRAQEERDRVTQQMQMLLQSTGQGIYGIDVQGKCTFINRASCEMLGYRAEDALGQNMHDLIHHHRPDGSPYPVADCPIYRAFQKGEGCRVDSEVLWRRDSTAIPVEYSSFPILEDGKITGAVITFVDITERKQAEEKLRESEQLFRSIFENAQIGIGVFKIDRQELSPNRALQEMLGYSEKELSCLETWDEITHPDESASDAKRYAELVQGKREKDEWEQRLIRRDGRIAVTSVRFSLLRDAAGRPQYVASLQEDITERRAAEDLIRKRDEELRRANFLAETAKEAALAATRAKSDFLANMSHEIRTPMNAILGMTYLALRTELTPKQRDYIAKTRVAAQALLGIINDILDFSKIEAGKMDMEMTEFRLDDVLENLSSIVSQKAYDKNLEFLIASPLDLPPNLVGDSLRLGQILINLVNNAVKFTEHGEVVVTAALEEKVTDRVKLKFSVRDSGIGMTPEQTARLFQAFSQADTSTTRKYGGTGLGLSISKRLVEMMGGHIWAESKHGEGSTFLFTAWFGLGSADTDRKRFIPDLAGIRVLVVDDNAQAREILTDTLRTFALRIDSVSSGEDAIRELVAADSQDPYQLVLMDWHMSGLDGLEASRIIKRGDHLKHVPKIIMVTAFGREDIRGEAEKLGIDGYLLKPVSMSVLFDTLMDLFGVAGQEVGHLQAAKDDARSHDASGIRILLVEDNDVNQQVATELLESAGASVKIANHGGEAVKILMEGDQQTPFDVVLMDLQMPEMDGFTATKLLRADPRFQDLAIIAMTAHALVEERQRCLEAGMDDHVTKPIDPDALFATLNRWAKPRRVRAAGPAVKPPRMADNVILPEIEGIDVAGGLKRVAGNNRLYRDLLTQFATKQCEAATQVSAALETGDRKLAERIAHTVKGVAGNIGLGQISTFAEKLERAIRDADSAVPALLEEFTAVLHRQIQAIQRAMDNVTPSQPTERERSAAFDTGAASTAVTRLRALLEASDGDASDAFPTVERILVGAVEKRQLGALGAAISEFDFEGALVKLNEITKEFGAKWGQPQ
jgi:PAS domain S-box-containing protein